MKLMTCLAMGFFIAAPSLWAETTLKPGDNTAVAVKDARKTLYSNSFTSALAQGSFQGDVSIQNAPAGDGRYVQLSVADKTMSSYSVNYLTLGPMTKLALWFNYRSSAPYCSDNRGSWVRISFCKNSGAGVGDAAAIFCQPTTQWKELVQVVNVPEGADRCAVQFRMQELNGKFDIADISIGEPSQSDLLSFSKIDTEGWGLSKGEVLKDPQGESFVRLALTVDRGGGQLSKLVPLETGLKYELTIEYMSNNEVSARDKGSWIYLAFRDEKDKNVGEQCETFEQTTSWKIKSIPLKTPAGTAKVYMSIRQQQRKGTFDLKSVELKQVTADAAAKVVMTLSPTAMAAMAYIATPGEKLNPDGERSPLDGNIFLPYLKGKAPAIVRDLGTENSDGVTVQKVVFRSMTVGGESQDVYAVIARPSSEGNYPGIIRLHGGYGCADKASAIRYAKAGYVAISPDLPGIADPKNCPNSVGPWAIRFAKLGKKVKPDPTADETFDAVVAALQAFDLLAAQPGVIKDRIGVTGISMGGYTTTMITGLLGERVRAAYSIYGCGFYDRGSEWTTSLRDLPDDQREIWLRNFDAGRRASGIKAPYFIAAAASDHFFWPPAVNSTVSAIPAGSNQAYAPANHRLTGIPYEGNLDLLYLGYWLKGEGQPFPKVTVESCQPQADGGKQITFSIQAPLPVKTATLYITAGGESWEKSAWEPISAQAAGENKFQAVIPADKVTKQGAWFLNVSDARPATSGSLVYGMDASGTGAALCPLGVVPLEGK